MFISVSVCHFFFNKATYWPTTEANRTVVDISLTFTQQMHLCLPVRSQLTHCPVVIVTIVRAYHCMHNCHVVMASNEQLQHTFQTFTLIHPLDVTVVVTFQLEK